MRSLTAAFLCSLVMTACAGANSTGENGDGRTEMREPPSPRPLAGASKLDVDPDSTR